MTREVGHVAGGEQQRTLALGEVGQLLFQACVFGTVPGDQVRGAAAGAELQGALAHGARERRMAREPEVVVAAEIDQGAAVAVTRMRCSAAPKPVIVRRLRRSCAASSVASAAPREATLRLPACGTEGDFLKRRGRGVRGHPRHARRRGGGRQPQAREQLPVVGYVRVAGGQELLAREDGVGAGEEAAAPESESPMRSRPAACAPARRHEQAGDAMVRTSRWVDVRSARQRRARHPHQLIDRDALGMRPGGSRAAQQFHTVRVGSPRAR